jgi:hypothetical protein
VNAGFKFKLISKKDSEQALGWHGGQYFSGTGGIA